MHIYIEQSNLFVAFVAVVATYIFLKILKLNNKPLNFIFGLLWLLLLPNTSYIFTDLAHLIVQWNISPSHISLITQYVIFEAIGVLMFIFAFSPVEVIVRRIRLFKKYEIVSLVAFNFLVAFGTMLGRFGHINSYVIFTNPLQALGSLWYVATSSYVLEMTLLFGVICNLVYFLFRKQVLVFLKRYFVTLL